MESQATDPPRGRAARLTNGARHDLLAIGLLLLLGSFACVHLLAIPVFEDEATQLRWIDRALSAGEWLQPLSAGKPLEVWPMTPLVRLGLGLPAIRVLHVLAGMIAAVLTYLLARKLGSPRQALICGVLLAICPFVIYLQRIALADTLLCPAAIAVLLASLALCESATRTRALGLALTLPLAAFCKFPVGFILALSLPLALLLMPADQRARLLRKPTLFRLVGAYVPIGLLALAVLTVVVIQLERHKPAGFGVHALVGIGLGQYQGIAAGTGVPRPSLAGELAAQLSWPVTLIWIVGLVAGMLWCDWRQRWLIAMGALPLLAVGLLANYWYSRYLLFTLPPLIIASVGGWCAVADRIGRFRRPATLAVVAVTATAMTYQSARLILSPLSARWSPLDRFQYFEGWGSGYGYPEAARYLTSNMGAQQTIFSLDGHSAYQLRTYLPPAWSARVRTITYADDGRLLRTEQERLNNLLQHAPVPIVISPQLLEGYLTTTFGPSALEHFNLSLIATFDKPGGRTQLALYEATRR